MAKELAMKFRAAPSPPPDKIKGPLVFDSEKRLELFHYLCRYPGSTLIQMARKLKISAASVRWHLSKLQPAFVTTYKFGKSLVAVPTGMLAPEDIPLFIALNSTAGRNIYFELLESHWALTADELVSAAGVKRKKVLAILAVLSSYGLVRAIKVGRFIRYTALNPDAVLGRRYARRMETFRKDILSKLAEAGYTVKIESSGSSITLIWLISSRKKRKLFLLSTAPLKTVLG